MAHRTFRDPDGNLWQAWDVVPSIGERRHGERRTLIKRVADYLEKRRVERRRRQEARIPIRPGYEQGWLAFESPLGTKRLAPIPPAWELLPEASLGDLLRRAVDAGGARRRLIE
jgi:hypothetical protein